MMKEIPDFVLFKELSEIQILRFEELRHHLQSLLANTNLYDRDTPGFYLSYIKEELHYANQYVKDIEKGLIKQ